VEWGRDRERKVGTGKREKGVAKETLNARI
jgi:hypothetical protein